MKPAIYFVLPANPNKINSKLLCWDEWQQQSVESQKNRHLELQKHIVHRTVGECREENLLLQRRQSLDEKGNRSRLARARHTQQ